MQQFDTSIFIEFHRPCSKHLYTKSSPVQKIQKREKKPNPPQPSKANSFLIATLPVTSMAYIFTAAGKSKCKRRMDSPNCAFSPVKWYSRSFDLSDTHTQKYTGGSQKYKYITLSAYLQAVTSHALTLSTWVTIFHGCTTKCIYNPQQCQFLKANRQPRKSYPFT